MGSGRGDGVRAPLFALIGVVQWTNTVDTTPLYWAGTDSWSALTPILAGSLLPHLWLYRQCLRSCVVSPQTRKEGV